MVIGEEEMVDSESESESDESPEAGPGISHIKTMDDIDILLEANKAIAFQEQLIQLAKTKIDISCQVKGCKEVVEITASYVGSAVYLTWECPRKHVRHKLCSQPLLNRGLHSGDLLISSSILASGNNYGKIELMSRFLNLHIPSKSSFHRMQTTYLVPAVDAMWENEEEEVRHQFQGQEVVLWGKK
ncbi:hypothetical protein FSP39_002918 [Pinctada imbricata]|uniref:Uncharacterized protein n=1 Tax=Pinctada imbricata TaxID=66713 RepID=A0AA88YST3_PINIB|nr:hypothetical protein FSP39_002918 [Pinctada imbricata]